MIIRTWLVLLVSALCSAFVHVNGGAALSAQEGSDAPHWAYGYMTPPSPGRSAPPCPPTAHPFPDCAYPVTPTVEDGIKRTHA